FGNRGGKNTYHYRPDQGRWALLSWDFKVGLGVDDSPPDAPLFEVADPAVARLYTIPSLLRVYWAGLDEALATFFDNAAVDPWLDTRYQVLAATGVADSAPIKTYVALRRAFLQVQLAGLSPGWVITAPANTF